MINGIIGRKTITRANLEPFCVWELELTKMTAEASLIDSTEYSKVQLSYSRYLQSRRAGVQSNRLIV